MNPSPRKQPAPRTPIRRPTLGGQMDDGTYEGSVMQQGGGERIDFWVNVVSADEEYWLFHPDYVAPSSSNANVRWRLVYRGAALSAGCAALRTWVCQNYPGRAGGVTLTGQSFAITDEGTYHCS